jgi:hypothetical protein
MPSAQTAKRMAPLVAQWRRTKSRRRASPVVITSRPWTFWCRKLSREEWQFCAGPRISVRAGCGGAASECAGDGRRAPQWRAAADRRGRFAGAGASGPDDVAIRVPTLSPAVPMTERRRTANTGSALRGFFGLNDVVNQCSSAYSYGQWASIAVGLMRLGYAAAAKLDQWSFRRVRPPVCFVQT